MRRLLLIALVALPIVLAACGDDDESSTTAADETTVSDTTLTVGAPDVTGFPGGTLTSEGVGVVTVGTTTAETLEQFGPPTSKQKGPGCELAPDSSGAIAWTYTVADGELILDFDAATGELGSYRATTEVFKTENGDIVGEPFSTLKASQGDALQPLTLGSEKPSTKAGIWTVKDGDNELFFDIRGGTVAAISGGHIEICE